MSRGTITAVAGLALLTVLGLVLIQRVDTWSAPIDPEAAGGDARRSTYVTAIFEDITARNPWGYYGPNTSVWNSYVSADSYPTLFRYTTRRFDYVPYLAADWPTPLQYDEPTKLWRSRVALQQGWMWSDGTPVTAHDIAFTFRAIAAIGANTL